MTKNWASEFEELNSLSEEERAVAILILQEMSKEGSSQLLDDLRYTDFDEIPVDIHTFMHDRKYLGNALYDPEGRFTVFPYWETKLEEIFPTNIDTAYNTIVFTGAIGLGKSTIAVICLLYMLYRLLCLKDPYLYYGMQPIDKISISLMNITLENAKGVALDKMNLMILASEWFMSHGEMKGTTNLNFVPDKHIELITASSNNQIIGRAIFCLDGETIVATSKGDFRLKELVNKEIQVPTLSEDGTIQMSSTCTVKPTVKTTEQYDIELEDGTHILCTPNHLLRLVDGTYKEALYLTEDDELMSVNTVLTYELFINDIIRTRGQWGITDEYYEGHHIVPRCHGGQGDTQELHENIIRLYPREHYIAHKLLHLENPHDKSLAYAFSCMAFPKGKTKRENMLSEQEYEDARLLFSKSVTGENNVMYGKPAWNKGKTKETDDRVRSYGESNKGRIVTEDTKKLQSDIKQEYYLTHDSFNKGMMCITDGITNKYINESEEIPEGWYRGSNAVGKHPEHTVHKKHVIKDPEAFRLQKSKQTSGKNNPMYGKGHLLSGGSNGRAKTYYIYEGRRFESRIEFVEYLHSCGETIEYRHIQEWETGVRRPKILKLYSHIVNNFTWRYKDED